MKTTVSQHTAMATIVAALLAIACLTGCGGGSSHATNATNAIAVADSSNNRVLIYNYPLNDGQSANVVFGKPNFTALGAELSASGMSTPVDIAEDGVGDIYISDGLNNRVLQFKPPFTNGMAASLVIGQPDFVTAASNSSQNGLWGPTGLAFDGSGNLWVADWSNSRVLEYVPPFTTGMNASLVIGQPNFTSRTPATTNSALADPGFIAFDASGNLWVTDSGNNRVLEFEPPYTNGMSASLVIGQKSFTAPIVFTAPNAGGLNVPMGIAFDSAANLWLSDTGNARVLRFDPPFSDGMSASLVLGQANFTSGAAAGGQNGLNVPFGISFDSQGNLAVADKFNNRALLFQPPFSSGQNASVVLGQPNFTTNSVATTATSQAYPSLVRPLFQSTW